MGILGMERLVGVGGCNTTTSISPNTGGIGRRSPQAGRYSRSGGVGGGGPGSCGESGSMWHMHGSAFDCWDRSVVQRARVALDWLKHGEGYVCCCVRVFKSFKASTFQRFNFHVGARHFYQTSFIVTDGLTV